MDDPTIKRAKAADARRRWRAANPEKALEASRRYEAANRDKRRAKNRRWREENAEYDRERCRAYYAKNADSEREKWRQWYASNPGANRAKEARRRAAMIRATPPWADDSAIGNIYRQCAEMNRFRPMAFAVDHIIPLRGKSVCGLHVDYNLRIISFSDNAKKSNAISMAELERRYG